jgi:hypothetical protein
VTLRQLALMGQKRRALHEKHRERCNPDVRHPIATVRPRPLVRQRTATAPQRSNKGVQRLHPNLESQIRFRRNRKIPGRPPTKRKSASTPRRQNENCCMF